MANQKTPNNAPERESKQRRDRSDRRLQTQSIRQFLNKARNGGSFEDLEFDIDEFEKGLPAED